MLMTMTTPLSDRIARWCSTGRATKILLHPKDYFALSRANGLIDKIEKQYSLPVVCLGGEEGLKQFIRDNTRNNKDEEDGS